MPREAKSVAPLRIKVVASSGTLEPQVAPVARRLSDLEGLFADQEAWRRSVEENDQLVYTVTPSPVPEANGELPQSITTIEPGTCGHELFMTKGHQHTDWQGEIYYGLEGEGLLLLFDGTRAESIEMGPGIIGYIPPGWAHRSVNTGETPYRFLAVYPGSSGHDYEWVVQHGMGLRAVRSSSGVEVVPFGDVA